MITPLSTSQIADRIRLAAHQTSDGQRRVTAESIARGELPPVPEPLLPPPTPVRSLGQENRPGMSAPSLEEVAGMVPRARKKTVVGDHVPGLLRPLFRNQGGFNSILLEAVDRLVEANRQLHRQNQELHERIMTLHDWMNTAAHTSSLQGDWMQAVENRLRGLTAERLSGLETRLAQVERQSAQSGLSQGLPPEHPAPAEPVAFLPKSGQNVG